MKASVRVSARAALLVLLFWPACRQHAPFDSGARYQRGLLLRERGDLAAALDLANRGLDESKAQPDSKSYWSFRLLKAEVLLGKGDTSQAATLLGTPAVLPVPDSYLQVRLLTDRGWLQAALGDFNGSLEFLNRALDQARSQGLTQLAAEIEIRRAGDFVRLHRYGDADSESQAALQLAKRAGDVYLQSSALATLGLVLMNTSRFDEALATFQEALVLYEQIQSKSGTVRTQTNIGFCYIKLGQLDKAASIYKSAGAFAEKIGDTSDQQFSLGRIGDLYQDAGDYQQARSSYRQALAIARRTGDAHWTANWLHNLTEVSVKLGDLDGAERYNREALALHKEKDDPERLWPEFDRGRIAEARRQSGEAEGIYRSVIEGFQNLNLEDEPSLILQAHAELANLLASAHRDREADAEFQSALALVNTQRAALGQDDFRITYFSSLVSLYQDYVDFLASEHRDTEALRVAESSRARVLSEKLGVPDPTAGLKAGVDYRKLAQTTRTILLSYWLAPRRSLLWVVTPAKIAQFELPPGQEIEALVRSYNQSIGDLRDPVEESSATGRKLYETLLAPAQSLIPPGSRVAIAPDGELHNLNFEALPSSSSSRYWIEDVRLSVVPSLELASRRTGPMPGRHATLLLIGDPASADARNYPRLAKAGAEIESIRRQFSQAIVRTGAAATPGAYAGARPERFSMIHFTAHAEANADDPLDSAIILSPERDRYKLYAHDVVGVPIHADLVTISACRSAAGRTYAGEGLVGFAWSFLQAGAHNVIAGLWEVDDQSTAELMDRLYAGLRGGLSPQEALRQAQLTLLKSRGPYRKPYYWAPFQVISDALPN